VTGRRKAASDSGSDGDEVPAKKKPKQDKKKSREDKEKDKKKAKEPSDSSSESDSESSDAAGSRVVAKETPFDDLLSVDITTLLNITMHSDSHKVTYLSV
jgi:hypothetical protein